VADARLRRWRLWWANVPIVSLLAFRWLVLHGAVVHDVALTKRAGRRRKPDPKAVLVRPYGWGPNTLKREDGSSWAK
jgi:hypothetical protein